MDIGIMILNPVMIKKYQFGCLVLILIQQEVDISIAKVGTIAEEFAGISIILFHCSTFVRYY